MGFVLLSLCYWLAAVAAAAAECIVLTTEIDKKTQSQCKKAPCTVDFLIWEMTVDVAHFYNSMYLYNRKMEKGEGGDKIYLKKKTNNKLQTK